MPLSYLNITLWILTFFPADKEPQLHFLFLLSLFFYFFKQRFQYVRNYEIFFGINLPIIPKRLNPFLL